VLYALLKVHQVQKKGTTIFASNVAKY